LRIQEVEKQVGITRKNIRFYEEEGLLKPLRNPENGYRDYSEADVKLLRKIRLLRKLDVPLESIRKLFREEEKLGDCLQAQIQSFEKRQEDLRRMRELCSLLRQQEQSLDSLDPQHWEERILQMEEEGVCFVDLKAQDKKRKRRAPLISAAVMILLMGMLAATFLWGARVDPIPVGILVIFLAVPLAVIAGVLLALRARMKEIEKGEEDAASEY